MKRGLLIGIIVLISNTFLLAQSLDPNIQQYIEDYKWWAMAEQQRTGVPAAIKLAQGIHETGAGTSELSLNANNHFGIKCRGNQWRGATYQYTDDRPNECFRAYNHPQESYKDHSDFLKGNQRYGQLFTLDKTDYKAWCNGLKKAGYATNPKYAQLLIHYIETYDLAQYTIKAEDENYVQRGLLAQQEKQTFLLKNTAQGYMSKQTGEDPKNVAYYELTTKNGLKGFYAKKGDLLLESAIKQRIRYNRLLQINDLKDEVLDQDMFIYLEPKHRVGTGQPYHTVRQNERLLHISQEYGIQLRTLERLNHINEEDEIVSGQKIYLIEENMSTVLVNKTKNNKSKEEEVTLALTEPTPKVEYVPTKKKEVATPTTQININKQEVSKNMNDLAAHTQMEKRDVEVTSTSSDFGYPTNSPSSDAKKESKATKEMSPLDRLKAHMDQNVYGTEGQPEQKTSVVNTSFETRPAGNSTSISNAHPATSNPTGGVHIVQKGETAYGISKKYDISLKQLSDWNQLNGNMNIQIGQRLKVQP